MATASDFPIEQNVYAKSNKSRKGVVIGNKLSDGDQVVAVEWADGNLTKANVNDIEKCLSLEEEFQLVQTQVNEKFEQAAALVREASALAASNGKDLQDWDSESGDPLFDTYVLKQAMNAAGWNTSSWNC
jgi:hypothetical protein